MAVLAPPHCSKCCPVVPPKPVVPPRLPGSVWVGFILCAAALIGGWALVMWLFSSLFS
ncbi:hypothetical protein [Streptomyces purpurogeneiscleroticus]|uniref:hypothetical protein n=1 Tax=Streptomyces purpurogeneiscleroticus TaxID=68259 RepID=UPI001CBF7066|nr:hypothetical protein [Streptomyces purpurogeneiscleroticus]